MTNNLQAEIARRRERANFGTAEHQQELAALADAVAALEAVAAVRRQDLPRPVYEKCRAALAQIAARLGAK